MTFMLMALAIFVARSATVNSHLIVTFTDGSTTSFLLADKPKVTFVDNFVRVTSNLVDSDFEASKVKKFVFGDQLASIDEVATDETRFVVIDPDHVSVYGLKAGENISVYSIDGRSVMNARAAADGSATLDLSELPGAIYIIATQSGKTIKIKH